MNQKTLHGLVDDDFNHIIKDVDVSKVVISLEFINMKKPNKMIDNILNTQNNEKDERVKSVGSYIYENNLYVQLKNDLIHYLSNSGSDILNKLLIFRNNNGLQSVKRESHLKILSNFREYSKNQLSEKSEYNCRSLAEDKCGNSVS